MSVITALYGYDSEEHSFLVNSYPYGNKRCRIRFWIEFSPSKGYRYVSQTEHPTTKMWNNPKKSTYYKIAACMYLDENNHVSYKILSEYSSAEQILEFIKEFPAYNNEDLKLWVKKKYNFTKARLEGKLVFTINKEARPDSEEDKKEMTEELVVWESCLVLLNEKKDE